MERYGNDASRMGAAHDSGRAVHTFSWIEFCTIYLDFDDIDTRGK